MAFLDVMELLGPILFGFRLRSIASKRKSLHLVHYLYLRDGVSAAPPTGGVQR